MLFSWISCEHTYTHTSSASKQKSPAKWQCVLPKDSSRFQFLSLSLYIFLIFNALLSFLAEIVRNENSMTPLNSDIEKSQHHMLMASRALGGHLPIRPTPLGIAAAAAAAAAFRGNIGGLPWPASQMSYPGMFAAQGMLGGASHIQGM